MSTTVRILILVGLLVISVISFIVCIKLSKKIDNNVPNRSDGDKVIICPIIVYIFVLIVTIALLFSYPNRVFLTIEKIEYISIIVLVLNLVMIGTLIIFYKVFIKNKSWAIFITIPIIFIGLFITCSGVIHFENISKKYIEETNKTVVSEKIEPFITKQARGIFVRYDENENIVSCKYYYIEDDKLEQNEITGSEIEDVIYIDDNEDSYIEKTETSIDYINHEMKPSSDQYSYTEVEESYVLYINEDQTVCN